MALGLAVAHQAADLTQGVHTATECLGPAQTQRPWNLSQGRGQAWPPGTQEWGEQLPAGVAAVLVLRQVREADTHVTPGDVSLLLPPVPPQPPMLPGSPPTLPLRFWRASGAHPWCRVPGSHHSCRPFPRGCCRPGLGSDLAQPPLPTPGDGTSCSRYPSPRPHSTGEGSCLTQACPHHYRDA